MASTDSILDTQDRNPPRIVSDIQLSDPTSSRSQKQTPRTKGSREQPGKARLSGMRKARPSTEARKKGEDKKRRIENLPDEHSQATTYNAAKEERHDDDTIEVFPLNTTHDPTTESRFELIQKMKPGNEVDDDVTDEGDDDLVDIVKLSKRATASRKRKSYPQLFDLTKEAPTPEPDGDINHPTKRLRGELPSTEEAQWVATANEVLDQLQSEGQRLKDSVLEFIMEVLFAIFRPHHRDNKSARVTHPLWFNADEETMPQELRDFEKYDVIFFPIHHKEIRHWTMGVLHITKRTIHCDFYDSLSTTASAKKVKNRIEAWVEESGLSRSVSFEEKICAQQNDTVSCGIFVLMNLRRLFRGEPVDLSIRPVDGRAQLLGDLLEHDASSLHLPSPSHSVLLGEVQALSQSYGVSQADGLEAENWRGLLDGEGAQAMPSALAKFVGKAMSFGSLDRLQGCLSIEETRVEKARSDLRQSEAAYENAVAKVNLINEIRDSEITSMEGDMVSLGTSSDRAQASSQSLESIIASLHDECLRVIQMKANREALDKLSRHREQEVKNAELRVRELDEEVTVKSGEVEKAITHISFLRRCVDMMELMLELEDGVFVEYIGDAN